MVPSRSRTSKGRGRGTAAGGDTAVRPLAPPEVGKTKGNIESVAAVPDEKEQDAEHELAQSVNGLMKEVQGLRKDRAFPTLEDLEAIDRKREAYLGPTMESNWVLPGKLLVGAYPASMNDSHHAHLLCTILLQGVSTFVCLQQEYRSDGVTEAMWRSGEALRPYYQDVIQLLRKLQELKAAEPQSLPPVCDPQETDFVHFPIVDCNVADDTKVLELALGLATRVARGEVLYLHCWGGHGRTGTVVSIMLHLMYDLGADEAMARCQHVHDVRRIPISVGSPQTDAQRQQVRRVIANLPSCRPRALSAPPTIAASADASNVASENPVSCEVAGGKASAFFEGGAGTVAQRAAATGGRRTWVRGRRQALAQAPNGVGENVPGWPSCGEAEGEQNHESVAEGERLGKRAGEKGPVAGSNADGVRASRSRKSTSPLPSRPQSPVTDEAEATAMKATTPTTSMPRRKSFTEPYSEEDPSRGTRNHRLRRKSTPGKTPAQQVLGERAATTLTGCPSKEEEGKANVSVSGGASSSRKHSNDGSLMVSEGGADIAASPGSGVSFDVCATKCAAEGVKTAGQLSPCRGSRRGDVPVV